MHNGEIMIQEPHATGWFDLSRLHGFKVFLQVVVFAAVAAGFLYELPQLRVLKISSVFLHESGHALMAFILQGKVHRIVVDPETEGGETLTEVTGENRGVAVNLAGYTFQALIGAFALAASHRQRSGVRFSIFLGCLTLFTLIAFFGKTPDTPTLQCGAMIIFACAVTTFLCWHRTLWCIAGSLILRCVGSFWCVYTLFDIYNDCWHTDGSDAHALTQSLGLNPMIFGMLFICFCLIALILSTFHSALPEPKPAAVVRHMKVGVTPRM